jgi:hypothetical protein
MQHSPNQYDNLARFPRTQTRAGCRRRAIASRYRRHTSARCSCRVVAPIRNARFVDVIRALSIDNSGRRQERVCGAQRPGAKIWAIATSVGSRDPGLLFEPPKMPGNCRLFRTDQEQPVGIELRGGGCSPHRTGLLGEFPANRVIYSEFHRFGDYCFDSGPGYSCEFRSLRQHLPKQWNRERLIVYQG